MARLDLKLAENVPGDLFVDRTCIDCDQCRQVAPGTFAEGRGHAFVRRQPATAAERHRALMALVTCPTASIGTASKAGTLEAARAFPEPIEPGSPICFCGYADESSFGASAYLIRRPEGNVLVDTPRAAGPLLARLRELGGVALHFLSHRDDVGHHDIYHTQFSTTRVIHEGDRGAARDAERVVTGGDPVLLAPDLLLVPVPGHTRGSAALLWQDALFTGDHLWAGDEGELDMGRDVCWWSWPEQVRSLERLLALEFTRVLPGHGRRFRADSPAAMRAAIERLLSRLG